MGSSNRAEHKSWVHFVAGGAGGMTAAIATAPLDVLKTRLQSNLYRPQFRHTSPLQRSSHSFLSSFYLHCHETFQSLFSISRTEGWRALYKGLGPTLTGFVPASAIKFYVYGNSKRIISDKMNGGKDTIWVHLLAAVSAGFVTSTATNPIWLVKTRLQLDKSNSKSARLASTPRYKNSLDCATQVFRNEGMRGMYKGLSASYLGVSESALQWVLYEQMKTYLAKEARAVSNDNDQQLWDVFRAWGGKFGAAGIAKLLAAVATYPHEVVRTRLRQAPQGNQKPKYTGLLQCFRLVCKEEGLVGIYGGLTPQLLRVVPSAAVMFGVYEVCLKLLGL